MGAGWVGEGEGQGPAPAWSGRLANSAGMVVTGLWLNMMGLPVTALMTVMFTCPVWPPGPEL